MFTHEQIWQGIDRLAAAFGYSPSGLARQAGLDPTSFNKSKRVSPEGKPRWPSTESLAKVLAATGATMSEFTALIESGGGPAPAKARGPAEIAAHTAEILLETESVLFNAEKPFTLKSGRKSPVYVDMRRLISFPDQRNILMDYAAKTLRDNIGAKNFDLLAGGETAGIPYAAFIAERLHKPMIYVRKNPKGHGRMAQIEGALPEKTGLSAVLIEDLQTDGGSKAVFIKALRKASIEVKHAFVLFHYGIFPESEKNMQKLGVRLHALATWHDVLAAAKKKKYFKSGTLESVERFLKSPHEWEN